VLLLDGLIDGVFFGGRRDLSEDVEAKPGDNGGTPVCHGGTSVRERLQRIEALVGDLELVGFVTLDGLSAIGAN